MGESTFFLNPHTSGNQGKKLYFSPLAWESSCRGRGAEETARPGRAKRLHRSGTSGTRPERTNSGSCCPLSGHRCPLNGHRSFPGRQKTARGRQSDRSPVGGEQNAAARSGDPRNRDGRRSRKTPSKESHQQRRRVGRHRDEKPS